MRRLIKFLLKYWKIAIFSPILMTAEVMIDLYQPLLMKNIIDIGIKQMNIEVVKTYALYMIGLSFIGMLCGSLSGVFAIYSSQSAGADMREKVFKKVQSLSFKNIDTLKTSSLITRLTNDVTQMQQFFQQLMRIMVRAPLMLVGSVFLTFVVSITYGSILVGFIALLLVVVLIIIAQGKPIFKKAQKKIDDVNNVMLENIKGMRVIKAFVRRDYENKRFSVENHELKAVQIKANRKFAILMPMISLTINLVILVILWLGAFDVAEGQMTVGQIVAVTNYITRLMFALMMTGMIFFRISRASASADRINEILDMSSEIASNSNLHKEIEGHIAFKKVSFNYSDTSGDHVLKDISFEVNPGETLAIIGATGAGKSTLLQLIPRFYDVNEGEILVDHQNIKSYDLNCLRDQIAYVQQQAFMFSGSIKNNVFFDSEVDNQIMSDAQAVKIMDVKDGYQSELKQRGSNLSGGQKQRLAIARGLAKKPKILILDDSTSALDPKTEFSLKQALKENYPTTTIVMVAQKVSSVMSADKIMVLDDGQVQAFGHHETLLKTSSIYRDIYESQLGKVIS